MKTYKHTQPAKFIIVAMSILALAFTIMGMTVGKPLFVAVPFLLLSAWLFSSLRIQITDQELYWRFGPGIVQKRVRLADITSVRAVRTTVLNGWGIHYTRFGWLYNVSGYNAVAVTLRNGKRFALGTDDPSGLVAALTAN